jgi:hypothetical protein
VEDAHALGRGVLLFTGHFGLETTRWHALRLPPLAVLARALDNPHSTICLSACERLRGTASSTAGSCPSRAARARSNGTVAMLIDQHMQSADSVVVGLLQSPCLNDLRACRDRRADRGAGDPLLLRCRCRGQVSRMTHEHPVAPPVSDSPEALKRIHATVHRRARDTRRYPDLWL